MRRPSDPFRIERTVEPAYFTDRAGVARRARAWVVAEVDDRMRGIRANLTSTQHVGLLLPIEPAGRPDGQGERGAMRGSPTWRIAIVMGSFDLLFAAVATASFLELVGLRGAPERAGVLVLGAGFHAAKAVVWIVVLHRLLRPLEAWLRAGTEDDDLLARAARAAYRFPLTYAAVFAALWGATYLLLPAVLVYAHPFGIGVPPRLMPPAAFFAAAVALAAFPFALLWAEYLSARERARVSLAFGAEPPADRAGRFSLGRRVLILVLCFTLAPAAWWLSMVIGPMVRIDPRIPAEALAPIGYFFLAVVLWAPICAWLLVRTLARPIGTVAGAIADVTRARDPRAAAPIPIFQHDELGSLAAGANEMMARLAEELERRAATAEENERLLRAAEVAVQVRDRFLEIASHELRTPLTPLRLNLEWLRQRLERDPAAADLSAHVEVALRQIDRLARLAEDLLDVSATAAGELALHREDVDLADLARALARSLEPAAARAGSTLRVDAPRPAHAHVDRRRIERVLNLLLDNAVKFGAGEPVDVRVEAGPPRVRISVRDRGIGVAEEDQQRIFLRFERAVSERHYGGFGLGLPIARTIVEAHGGTLALTSRPGEGATFTMELPTDSGPTDG